MLRCAAVWFVGARLLFAIPPGAGPAESLVVPPPRLPTLSEALEAAIRLGELDEVKRLIRAGADADGRDSFGNTPLLYAALAGDAGMVAYLLEQGANVNAVEAGPPILGRSVLEAAILANRAEVVKVLLGAGALPNGRENRDGRTPLHLAARYGGSSIAELLLGAHANIGAVDEAGHTPLDVAVAYGQASVVSLLLAHGADPGRVRAGDGRGPVHEAAIKGTAVLIDLLVAAGAPPALRDKSGQTPLDLALAYKNAGAIAALERLAKQREDCRAAVDSAMESATRRGLSETVRLLVAGGLDVRKPTQGGSTYLHEAALAGQAKVAELLLERGAPVDALDDAGQTPLHSAALGGSTETIAALLDRGARVDASDRDAGATPLMLAAAMSRTGAVGLLLKRGAKAELRDRGGRSALDRARATDDFDVVALLESALAAGNGPGKRPV